MTWRDFPLPSGSYDDVTKPWSSQDVVNFLPTFAAEAGPRSPVKYQPVPGLYPFGYVGDGPHRGAHNCEGKRFVVSGRKLYQVSKLGVSTELGTIPGTGRVTMAHNQIDNGNEVIIATGDNSYVWNTVTETLTATGIPLLWVDFINQRFVGVDRARRFWRHSALADGLSWSDLDVFSSESSPDRITGLKVVDGQVVVFNERTTEVFVNEPTDTAAFQRSVVIQRGCLAGDTVTLLGGALFFVGDDYAPYRLDGYTPTPIGPKPIVAELSQHEARKLFGLGWEDRGYLVYYITAQDGVTWGYDITSQRWHRRESYGLDRWRVNTLFKADGDWYAGDYTSGQLYRLQWGYMYEGCEVMPRRIRTGVLHNNGNRIRVDAIRLFVETGGEPSVPNCGGPYVPDIVFLGYGSSAGFTAISRPLSYAGVWQGAADDLVTSVGTTSSNAVMRYGDYMAALVIKDGGGPRPIRLTPITDLSTWSDGATTPSGSANGNITVSGERLFFWVSSTATLYYLDTPMDASFTTGPTLTGGIGNSIQALAGNGTQVLAANINGSLYGSANNGTSFTNGVNLSTTGLVRDSIGVNGSRFVIACGGTTAKAYYTDDVGATATASTWPSGAPAQTPSNVVYCGGNHWLIAFLGTTAGKSALYHSADNGATFLPVTLPTNIYFDDKRRGCIAVDGISGRVVVAGKEITTGTQHYYYTDNFTDWTEISRAGVEVTRIASVYPGGYP